jgi:L-ascorbate metabolism protein UlaG (beta-lactamase superfamily)
MKLRFLGHASIWLEINGSKVLIDPFITQNDMAQHINIDELDVDFIFLTHGHEDHVADVERIVKRTGAQLVANFEICQWYEKRGYANYHPMNTGGTKLFDKLGKVKVVNAVHSSTMPDGSSGGHPNGYLFTTSEGNFYVAGDTALTMDMKLIPLWAAVDFAILPIGDNFTMGMEDAVLAAQFVETKRVVGIHYDTFGYIKIDKEKAKNVFSQHNIELILLEIGEMVEL